MDLIKNDYGKKAVSDQFKSLRWHKLVSLSCLLLLLFCLFFSGWLKFTAVIPLLGALYMDKRSRSTYEEILYHERDKERLALYLEASLPEYTVLVNPQICNPHPHLLVIGPTGVFIIMMVSRVSLGMNQKGDTLARSIQSAIQILIPHSPLKTFIYNPNATLLKPAVGRLTVISSLFALINQIQNHKGQISPEESASLLQTLRT